MRYSNWLAVLGAAALVAGCGTVQAGQRAIPSAGAIPAAATAPAAGAAPAAAAAPAAPADVAAHPTPRQQANASAAAALAAFIAPPHAVRTGALPVSWLSQSANEPTGPDLATRTGWWRVTGQPQAVLGWIQAHRPRGSAITVSDGGSTVGGMGVMWFDVFTLPPAPGAPEGRELVVAVAADGPDRTAIRVDVYVQWIPARTAAEAIPASARVVTITPVVGTATAGHPVTITDPARVARIAAAVPSGARHEHHVVHATGSVDSPMTDEQLRGKCALLLAATHADRAGDLYDVAMGVDALDSLDPLFAASQPTVSA